MLWDLVAGGGGRGVTLPLHEIPALEAVYDGAMAEEVQCVNAFPVRRNGETVVRRCTGRIVPSSEGDSYVCSVEGEEMTYRAEVVQSFEDSALWHRACAISKMLARLTPLNPRAENSTYPWIDLPLNHSDKAVVESSGGWWNVHFHIADHPIETQPVDIPTSQEDTEAVAHAIARVLHARA